MKKRIGLSLIGLFAVSPAWAESQVQWFGSAQASFLYEDPQGTSVQSLSSTLGVRGREELGEDFYSIFELKLSYQPFVSDAREDLSAEIGLVGLKSTAGTLALGNLPAPSYVLLRQAFDVHHQLGASAFSAIGSAETIEEAVSWTQSQSQFRFGFASQASSVAGQANNWDLAMQWPLAGSGYFAVAVQEHNHQLVNAVSMSVEQQSRWHIGWVKQDSANEVWMGLLSVPLQEQQRASMMWEQVTLAGQESTDFSLGIERLLSPQTTLYTELQTGDQRDAIAVGLAKDF